MENDMKYFVYITILLASIFCLNTTLPAAVAPDVTPNSIVIEDDVQAPTVVVLKHIQDEVTKGAKSFQERFDNVDNASYYKNWEAKDAVTDKTKTIKDLNDQQLRGFFIYQAEVLHQDLLDTRNGWRNGLEMLKIAKVPASEKKSAQVAHAAALKDTIELVEKALDKILLIHKKLAVKREAMISDMIYFYKDKDKDLVKELEKYLEDVKAEDNKLGLADIQKDDVPEQKKDKK